MSEMCYMAGYGTELDDLAPFLKEEYKELSSFDIIDEIEKKGNSLFCSFNGEKDYIYIPCVAPYEEPMFKSYEEIDNYFYEKLKPFLKENIKLEQISIIFDDVFDWDYC